MSLLRGDTAARATFYKEMWSLGVFSTNDIRELEDMNPVADGDKRFVPMNMTTLEKAGEEPEPVPRETRMTLGQEVRRPSHFFFRAAPTRSITGVRARRRLGKR